MHLRDDYSKNILHFFTLNRTPHVAVAQILPASSGKVWIMFSIPSMNFSGLIIWSHGQFPNQSSSLNFEISQLLANIFPLVFHPGFQKALQKKKTFFSPFFLGGDQKQNQSFRKSTQGLNPNPVSLDADPFPSAWSCSSNISLKASPGSTANRKSSKVTMPSPYGSNTSKAYDPRDQGINVVKIRVFPE